MHNALSRVPLLFGRPRVGFAVHDKSENQAQA